MAALVAEMKKWSPECRASALNKECGPRCDDFISDMIIKASSTQDEKLNLLQTRYERNSKSVNAAVAILAKVNALASYARSIIASPRSSAHAKNGATLDEQAEEPASGNPCLTRMRSDFAKVDSLDHDVEGQLGLLPIGFVELRTTLSFAKACVDCSNDRSMCKDMMDSLKVSNQNLSDWRKSLSADKKTIATLNLLPANPTK